MTVLEVDDVGHVHDSSKAITKRSTEKIRYDGTKVKDGNNISIIHLILQVVDSTLYTH